MLEVDSDALTVAAAVPLDDAPGDTEVVAAADSDGVTAAVTDGVCVADAVPDAVLVGDVLAVVGA